MQKTDEEILHLIKKLSSIKKLIIAKEDGIVNRRELDAIKTNGFFQACDIIDDLIANPRNLHKSENKKCPKCGKEMLYGEIIAEDFTYSVKFCWKCECGCFMSDDGLTIWNE